MDFSVRQVIIFGSDYQRKVTLEFDKTGNKLFNYAYRIRTDYLNIVYVVDCLDDEDNGRLVAVDRNDRLKFTYDAHTEFGIVQSEGITITPGDNIVVADYHNKSLYILI